MKKIIAAFDGLNFSESAKDYAIFMAQHMNAHLVGVFLEDFTRHSYSVTDITKYAGTFDEQIEKLNHRDKDARDAAVSFFEQDCQYAGIHFSVHRDKNIALFDLLHESVYSDLLIIDRKETLTRYEEIPPTRFVRDLLTDLQCPALVVPSQYKTFEQVVLLYDGEPSSVFAAKMFSYLMPSLKTMSTLVLSAKKEGENLHLPENKLMKEFMKRHYPKAEYIVVKGFVEDKIVSFIAGQEKESLVVLGAYRRGRMSRLFRPSMADVLMNHLQLPLFIAHNK